MLTTTLIDAVKARLTASLPKGTKVSDYPDQPDTYALKSTVELLVQYLGAKQEPGQGRQSMIGVVVVAKTNATARKWLEAATAVLHGWHLTGAGRTMYVEDQLIGEENGTWRYAVQIVIPNALAPVQTDAALAARFTELGI